MWIPLIYIPGVGLLFWLAFIFCLIYVPVRNVLRDRKASREARSKADLEWYENWKQRQNQ